MRVASIVALVMVARAIAACSGPSTCTPGAVTECACPGGASGTQTCASNGTFGTCACQPSDASIECIPACRAGFECVRGECVSACNPPCAPEETCTVDRTCVGVGSDAMAPDALDASGVDAGADDAVEEDIGPDVSVDVPTMSCMLDTDGDGIPDFVEGRFAASGPTDTDSDGMPDYLDLDSDGDGILDSTEWAGGGCDPTTMLNDADADGVPNFRDLDSDENGLADRIEVCPPASTLAMLGRTPCGSSPYDFDGDGIADYLDPDNDHDTTAATSTPGVLDVVELRDSTGTNVGLLDTDTDGVPDVYDVDSDDDLIEDLEDGTADRDSDGTPNFRDGDSDQDGVGDRCEARAHASPPSTDLTLPLLDTDGDGQFDFLDRDSDADLLVDRLEDTNGNCILDSGETDRLHADSDTDGVSDFIERTLLGATAARDPTMTPARAGRSYFVVPYSGDGSARPVPTASTLALSSTLNRADVGFVVDTTSDMGGAVTALRATLGTSIAPALRSVVPSLAIGIAGSDDVPCCLAGTTGDLPFYVAAPPSGYMSTTVSDSQAAANALVVHNGGDAPEAQVLGAHAALAGLAITWPGGSVPAATPPTGTFGGLYFRSDALPVLVMVTNGPMHNGKRALDTTGAAYDSTIQSPYSFSAVNADGLVTSANARGARIIGITADGGTRGTTTADPYGYLAYLTDHTSSYVPPSAFSPSGCHTVEGTTTAIPADGPTVAGVHQCRLVFSTTSWAGLATAVVDGFNAVRRSLSFNVHAQAYNDPASMIDVVASFVASAAPLASGGTDPISGGVCVTFPASQLADLYHGPTAIAGPGDVMETIRAVNPSGSLYCLGFIPTANTTVAATATTQVFRAWVRLLADRPAGGTFTLGADRAIDFIVPPLID